MNEYKTDVNKMGTDNNPDHPKLCVYFQKNQKKIKEYKIEAYDSIYSICAESVNNLCELNPTKSCTKLVYLPK